MATARRRQGGAGAQAAARPHAEAEWTSWFSKGGGGSRQKVKLLKVSEQGKSEEWLLFSRGKTWSTTSQSRTYLREERRGQRPVPGQGGHGLLHGTSGLPARLHAQARARRRASLHGYTHRPGHRGGHPRTVTAVTHRPGHRGGHPRMVTTVIHRPGHKGGPPRRVTAVRVAHAQARAQRKAAGARTGDRASHTGPGGGSQPA